MTTPTSVSSPLPTRAPVSFFYKVTPENVVRFLQEHCDLSAEHAKAIGEEFASYFIPMPESAPTTSPIPSSPNVEKPE